MTEAGWERSWIADKRDKVRRKDREVKDIYGIREIMRECDCCKLVFPHGKSVYIVPLSFGYNEKENAFYFRRAAEGKKMDLVRQIGCAGFGMDTAHGLKETDQAYGCSFRCRSVVGEGPIRVVEEVEEKKKGLNCIVDHISGKDGWTYPEAMLRRTTVLRLDMEQMSGKEQLQRLQQRGKNMFESRCRVHCNRCERKETVRCTGCIAMEKPFWGGKYGIKSCCEAKGLNHCGGCPDFPCEMKASMGMDVGFDAKPRLKQCRE